ncbi:MAG: RNA polymerase sigma factor RpoH [Rickettsiales bacterium]|nr:RNA polymerase sigma factor RpoH [Rickettsiales bacterium]OUV52972.1 MAG: RNA polymerase factor sigma-32 [Rickettsiales bacterium TMED127]|tara:strand:+ start:68597 stop:69490 length:894 start_codon:yes stop_codon:yes gene_type:complete
MLKKIKHTISKTLDENGLSKFLREIRKFPVLTFDEENKLANDWVKHKNPKSAHKLVNSHLRLVVKIAMGFRGYGIPLNELVSEGNVGMIQSLERFDPSKGFRLSTYAMWWIRASIQEYILHSWSMVKIGTTAAQKKLFFNLRSLKGKLKAIEDGDLQPELVTEIADRLDVSELDVIDMNRRMSGHDHSLNSPLSDDNASEWINGIIDDRDSQENEIIHKDEFFKRKQILMKALENLNERERQILVKRRLTDEPLTLEELSKFYGISRERVRQVEVRAFEKLRKVVKNIDYNSKNFNQ